MKALSSDKNEKQQEEQQGHYYRISWLCHDGAGGSDEQIEDQDIAIARAKGLQRKARKDGNPWGYIYRITRWYRGVGRVDDVYNAGGDIYYSYWRKDGTLGTPTQTIQPLSPVEWAALDGKTRGQQEEHRSHPGVTDHSSAGIAQLANILGYKLGFHREGAPMRRAFIQGYCESLTEIRKNAASQESDPMIRQYRLKIVHCAECGCELTPDMSYRTMPTVHCNDCIEEFPELLRV